MTIYLNNAASGWPRAEGVCEAMTLTLQTPPFHPGRVAGGCADVLTICRRGIAELVDAPDPTRIVLTTNATHALNLAFWGVKLNDHAHVITTVTEHNSVLRPLHHVRERFPGLRLTILPTNATGALDEEQFDQALEREPTLVVINHASNVTGRVNEVEQLFQKAKKAGAMTLLDASQSLGSIPISVKKIQADLIAFTGHKGLHGPAGTGALYVNPSLELEQVFVGGTGVRSDLMLHPANMPMRLEAGTPNMPSFAGLAAALRWYQKEGAAHAQKATELANRFREALMNIPKVKVFDGTAKVCRTPVISIQIAGWAVEEIGYVLAESFGIICRTGLHCAPLIHQAIGSAPEGTVRFSFSGFNTELEMETALDAVRRLAA
ncbi:MAG: aminotransferase class V-fold PLP-dependent enzyme [Candidatus Omnitrophota bacterium]|jgi:cysteine desulfurase family protein|nr:MAG: aminotransferase class V-fold PLP-dependent enzyme [Candidatus Omnitrophota bacterium]